MCDINEIVKMWDLVNKAERSTDLVSILNKIDISNEAKRVLIDYLGNNVDEIRSYWSAGDFFRVVKSKIEIGF